MKYFHKLLRHFKAFGIIQAIKLILAENISPGEKIRVHISDLDISLRCGTHDIAVCLEVIFDEEYRNIQLSNPKTIIDAGAHIGLSAIYFAKRYPDAQIIALEPERSNYELLAENVKQFSNVVPLRAALWSNVQTRNIIDTNSGTWGYSIAEPTRGRSLLGQEVDCLNIPALCRQFDLDHIDFLKIDIEGSEKQVLDHCGDWIEMVSVICAELHDRIQPGCDAAFRKATAQFARFTKDGEKITAYRT